MPVTDQQVATLRALLANDPERHDRLFAQLDRGAAMDGYTALVTGAFCEAVDRRFSEDAPAADVIDFVADVRSRSERLTREVDPVVAERVIRVVLSEGSLADLSPEVVVGAQIVLLTALIADEHLDDAGLDAFLAKARKLGDELMG